MTPRKSSLRYQTFLLRIWEERGAVPTRTVYRFSLESSHTRKRHGFASLEQLTAFLLALTTPESDLEQEDSELEPLKERTTPDKEVE
jgi:hypothetical protein